jgi:hypothetical protein
MEFRGEKTGWARDNTGTPVERADATDDMDSERRGAANRSGATEDIPEFICLGSYNDLTNQSGSFFDDVPG